LPDRPDDRPTGPDLIVEHLAWCEARNLRPASVEQRRLVLRKAERSLPMPLLDADHDTLRTWLARPSLGVEARAHELSQLRQFYKWAQAFGYRDDEPTARVPRPRTYRRLPRPLEPSDVARALAMADGKVRLMVALMAYAGLRAGEVAKIRREDILDQVDPPVIFVADGKGGRQRVIPCHPAILDALMRHPVSAGWLFPKVIGPGAHREHVHPAFITNVVADHLRACGIDATGHQLRHTFGTQVYRHTLDLRTTQEVLGHASPVTTAGYAAWTPSAAAAGVAEIDYGTAS
jgi:integrase/recombinase XerC